MDSIHKSFQEEYKRVIELFFDRNADYWPCLADPAFQKLINFRKNTYQESEAFSEYPKALKHFESLKELREVPHKIKLPDVSECDDLLLFTAAFSKNWEDPSAVENVVTMASDPAVYGSMMGLLANPNLVYSEYSGMAVEMEKAVVRQIASLTGYCPEKASGFFTQGGTFCNLYGYLIGIRKSLPEASHFGMGYIHDYRIINSQGGHYSNTTNLSLLGVNLKEKTIRIKVTENNDIDVSDLKLQLESCFRLKCVVPTIMLTMGTTDTFGVDKVKEVYEIREELCEKYDMAVKPHIHVDSAIGWSMIFFLNYDFDSNPLNINDVTLLGIQRNVSRFKELKYADSFTVDFQKWGYVPYTSSLVMFKDSEDLEALVNDPTNFTYFEKEAEGNTHLQYTIECSRGASGMFGAYNGLKYLGVEGYQTILAHCLQNANYFRQRLQEIDGVKILAYQNQGPSVGFKLYDSNKIDEPELEFDYEYNYDDTEEYRNRVEENVRFHRSVFLNRGKKGLYTNWVEFIARTDYDEKGNYRYIPGEKAVFMNPRTTRKEIDLFIENIFGSIGENI